MKDINKSSECPECGSSNVVHYEDKEQIVCKDCGLIFEPLTPRDEEEFEQVHDG